MNNIRFTVTPMFIFSAIGAVSALVYLYNNREALKKWRNSILDPVANVVVDTMHDKVTVRGQIRLPNGEVIPVQSIVDGGGIVEKDGSFQYRGNKYRITGRDAGGIFVAVDWYGL